MKSCFLIGHRDTPESIYPLLLNTVDFAATVLGIKEFIVGHYGLFDHMAAKAVLTLRRSDPELSLFLLLPYHPAERPIQAPTGFDGTFYPPGMESVPRRPGSGPYGSHRSPAAALEKIETPKNLKNPLTNSCFHSIIPKLSRNSTK